MTQLSCKLYRKVARYVFARAPCFCAVWCGNTAARGSTSPVVIAWLEPTTWERRPGCDWWAFLYMYSSENSACKPASMCSSSAVHSSFSCIWFYCSLHRKLSCDRCATEVEVRVIILCMVVLGLHEFTWRLSWHGLA